MGNAPSSNSRLYHRLDEILPTPALSCFGGKDREQFIWAIITVITQNGALPLGDHELRLLYSRRATDRIVARLVAEKGGVIKTKIEPSADGKDQAEAFDALRRDVEIRLDAVLSEVPGANVPPPAKVDSSPTARRSCTRPRPSLAPPPGQSRGSGNDDADGIVLHGDGPPAYGVAVKEWKAGDEKRG